MSIECFYFTQNFLTICISILHINQHSTKDRLHTLFCWWFIQFFQNLLCAFIRLWTWKWLQTKLQVNTSCQNYNLQGASILNCDQNITYKGRRQAAGFVKPCSLGTALGFLNEPEASSFQLKWNKNQGFKFNWLM